MAKTKNKKTVSPLTLGEKIKKVLINYFTTQFILMIIVGVVTWGILALLNVRFAITLGVVTGVLSSIPVVGMLIATIAATLVAIFDNMSMWQNSSQWLEGLIVLAVLFIFNKFVDLLIAPIFLGKTNKVNPIVLILVVFIGTVFFGVWGAILSVPAFLVVKTTIEHYTS